MFYQLHHKLGSPVRILAGGILSCVLGLTACSHHGKTAGGSSAITQESALVAMNRLESALKPLDEQLAAAYGPAIQPSSVRPTDAEWPSPVGKMVATERTLLDFSKAEALAVKCAFPAQYLDDLQAAGKTLAAEDLVKLGYRSAAEVTATREAELAAAKAQLRGASLADCTVQDSRVKATAALAKSLSEPRAELSPEFSVQATFHKNILRLAKLGEVSERCAVPDDTIFLLGEIEKSIQELATMTGSPMEEIPAWHNEGVALGQFAFSAWPAVNCDLLRKSLSGNTKVLEATKTLLQTAVGD